MTKREIERVSRGKVHHLAIVYKNDGSEVEGYLQPWDNVKVYLTKLDGTAVAGVPLADIKRIEFPDG